MSAFSFFGPAAIQLLDLQVEKLAEHAGEILPVATILSTALRPLAFGLVIVLFLMFDSAGNRKLVANCPLLYQALAVSLLIKTVPKTNTLHT